MRLGQVALLSILTVMLVDTADARKSALTGPGLLPADPCLRAATKALRGDYGQLQEWQRVGYQQALRHGVVWADAWVTVYYPQEGHRPGDRTRWGWPVDERCAAANELPGYAFVWCNASGIRQVLDTGADRNDRVARRKGAEHWVDFWVPYPTALGFCSAIVHVAAIRGRQPAQWKHGRSPSRPRGRPPAHAWLAY
ncbi:MAG: hypothetical protein U9R79_05915 [Armatimonadota bacterium]|nr:hypothetical protein [Armatimonadota bacterium]